ncbi:MAG TPA: four helix bundle protein [Planctomycetaceae bacterium]|nr:four helix bundle protein [Planctomycetaceae bacterium]
MKKSVVRDKSYTFALRIVRLYQYLTGEKREFVLAKQVLRSGTATGALVHEAEQAESRADFVHKLSIALKETHETGYWLLLLKDAEYITPGMFESIDPDCSPRS